MLWSYMQKYLIWEKQTEKNYRLFRALLNSREITLTYKYERFYHFLVIGEKKKTIAKCFRKYFSKSTPSSDLTSTIHSFLGTGFSVTDILDIWWKYRNEKLCKTSKMHAFVYKSLKDDVFFTTAEVFGNQFLVCKIFGTRAAKFSIW